MVDVYEEPTVIPDDGNPCSHCGGGGVRECLTPGPLVMSCECQSGLRLQSATAERFPMVRERALALAVSIGLKASAVERSRATLSYTHTCDNCDHRPSPTTIWSSWCEYHCRGGRKIVVNGSGWRPMQTQQPQEAKGAQ